jgi:hypothetical protein
MSLQWELYNLKCALTQMANYYITADPKNFYIYQETFQNLYELCPKYHDTKEMMDIKQRYDSLLEKAIIKFEMEEKKSK